MILASLNTKIRVLRVLRDNPRFAAYTPKCDLHSDNIAEDAVSFVFYSMSKSGDKRAL